MRIGLDTRDIILIPWGLEPGRNGQRRLAIRMDTGMQCVEMNLDWKGNLRGYTIRENEGTRWIPNDPANRDYAQLQTDIESRQLVVLSPQFNFVRPTFTDSGAQSGFDTNVGFVPLDPQNPLYVHLMKALNAGECVMSTTSQMEPVNPSEYVSALIVVVTFEQRWMHLAGEYCGKLPIGYNRNGKPEPFQFTLRNFGEELGINPLQLALKTHDLELPEMPYLQGTPVGGAIEVEIPVRSLRKILRSVLADADDPFYAFLRDQVDMELVRSGRKATDGPSTAWLVSMANNFLAPFLADFCNRVIEAFWQEYGGVPIAHVTPASLQQRFMLVHRLESGRKIFGGYSQGGSPYNFALKGVWQLGGALASVGDGTVSTQHPLRRSLSRLRMLLESGFRMEALVLMNSILEVTVLGALQATVKDSPDVWDRVRLLGHGRRLKLLEELRVLEELDSGHNTLRQFIDSAEGVYEYRNMYVHALIMPDEERFLDYREQRKILELMKPFSDVFLQDQWFHWLQSVSFGGEKIGTAIAEYCERTPADEDEASRGGASRRCRLRLLLQPVEEVTRAYPVGPVDTSVIRILYLDEETF